MPDYNFKAQFPIAAVIEAAQRKKQIELEAKSAEREQLHRGIKDFATGIGSALEKRRAMAQQLARGAALAKNPEVQGLFPGSETGSTNATPEMITALLGNEQGNLLTGLAKLKQGDANQSVFTIDPVTQEMVPVGTVKKGSKVVTVPRMNPSMTESVDESGNPLYFDPREKALYPVAVPKGGKVLPKKGDESSLADANLLSNQLPNIKTMFDAYRSSKSPRLQSTQAGRLLNPAGKQAEDSLKLAAFSFGGKNLTGQEKDVIFGALFPSWTDNEQSRNAKEALLTNFMTGKIDLMEAANLLGPAGATMRTMLERKMEAPDKTSKKTFNKDDQEAEAAIATIRASNLNPAEKARRISIVNKRRANG